MFSWLNFLTYAIITAITPGPNNIISMTNAGKLGFKKAFPFTLGIFSGFLIVMISCTLFSNALSTALPIIEVPMLIIGAAYMLYLAYKTWKSKDVGDVDHSKNGFLAGLMLQFVNPKIYIYCIVSMQAYILPYFAGQTAELLGFALVLASIGFICVLLWTLFGSVFRVLFSKYAKITNTIMALLLVYCAISLFL